MEVVTGDRYLESLVKFVEKNVGQLIEGSMVLKLNPVGLHYVYSRLDALRELESLISGAPVDYLRAYISDLGDHRAIEQLRRILCRLTSLKVVSVLPSPARDPTPLYLLPFGRLKVLELRGCDLSTSAARGLLELRHTLEKLVCHNSTDALRHIFASRISEIKDSLQWNRLSFVSCAFNRLVLMDESLQLLPSVEILDLSRNKFAKVDNLRKCAKLSQLDLGFNQLRSVAPFREITHVVKLVLRNNSLTTLQGIENLKSLEELDLSYNIMSKFSELEVLSALPCLRNLWLEGNPFCCARWYRPQVFSYFPYPEKLNLDDKEISTREFWKRQIVIARRQTRPASYGFYSPAREDTEEEIMSRKTKKVSRLAAIESEDRKNNTDLESMSSGNEIHSGEEKAASVDDPEVPCLINKSEVIMVNTTKPGQKHLVESLKYESDSIHASDYHVLYNLEFEDSSAAAGVQHYHHLSPSKRTPSLDHGQSEQSANAHLMQDYQSDVNMKKYQPAAGYSFHTDLGATRVGNNLNKVVSAGPTGVVNENFENSILSNYPRSPPHYQEDILVRLHDLEDEMLQLSADSFSLASSDSDTSSDEDGISARFHSKKTSQQVLHGGDSTYHSVEMNDCQTAQHYVEAKPRGCSLDLNSKEFCDQSLVEPECSLKVPRFHNINEENSYARLEVESFERIEHRRKVKKRVIPLVGEDYASANGVARETQSSHRDEMIYNDSIETCRYTFSSGDQAGDVPAQAKNLRNCVENYFNSVIANSGAQEICREFILCSCIVEQEMQHKEREVCVVLSSEGKLYSISANAILYGSGNDDIPISSYKVEDISDILVGLGLQVVRIYVAGYAAFMYIIKSAETSRHFFGMLEALNSAKASHRSCLRSLECVQIELFGKNICGLPNINIFQYSMVYFTPNDSKGISVNIMVLFTFKFLACLCELLLATYFISPEKQK
ncbi:hypothetical protein V2J09_011324 [Rumex salicifolius]